MTHDNDDNPLAEEMLDAELTRICDALNKASVDFELWTDMLGDSVRVENTLIYPPSQNANGPDPAVWAMVFMTHENDEDDVLDVENDESAIPSLRALRQIDVHDSEHAMTLILDVLVREHVEQLEDAIREAISLGFSGEAVAGIDLLVARFPAFAKTSVSANESDEMKMPLGKKTTAVELASRVVHSPQEACRWIADLMASDLDFHLDDSADSIIDARTHERVFRGAVAIEIDRRVAELFNYLHGDPHGPMLAYMRQYQQEKYRAIFGDASDDDVNRSVKES